MRISNYLLPIFIWLGLFTHLATANEALKLIKAVSDPWPPYIDEHHPEGGLIVELTNAALKTQGYQVKNKIIPWARALDLVKHGQADVILDAWWTQERSLYFSYSRPIMDGPVRFIKRNADPFTFKHLNDLSGKRIARVRDYAYNEYFLNANNYTPFDVTDFMQGIRMLEKSRVDLTLDNEVVARTRIKQERPELLDKIQFVDKPLENKYVYIVAGYKNPRHVELISAINRGLETILENGRYFEIVQKYDLPVPAMYQSYAK